MVVGIIYKKYSLCTWKYSITVMKQFNVHHLRQQTLFFTSLRTISPSEHVHICDCSHKVLFFSLDGGGCMKNLGCPHRVVHSAAGPHYMSVEKRLINFEPSLVVFCDILTGIHANVCWFWGWRLLLSLCLWFSINMPNESMQVNTVLICR
jgi:hypothetical protein